MRLQDLLYDAWKVNKILQPAIVLTGTLFPPLRVQFRHPSSSSSSSSSSQLKKVQDAAEADDCEDDYDATAEYDLRAVRHGWLCLLPLLLGLPVYYLQFFQYKSW